MKRQPRLVLILLGLLAGLLAPLAQAVESQRLVLQPPALEGRTLNLRWWVEGLRGQSVSGVDLLVDGAPVAIQPRLEPARGQSLCYLLMIDASKSMPAAGKADSGVMGLLKAIVETKPPQHTLGIVTFGKQAKLLQAPSKEKAPLQAALAKIKFDQERTELYRFIENGIKELGQCKDAYRPVLLLVSDGIAEDQSYSKEDAIQFARDQKVSIYSLVVRDSEALQNPIYLAEKTGGWGAEPARLEPQSRAKTLAALYAESNSGGDLQASLPEGQPKQGIKLRLKLSDGSSLTADVPLPTAPLPSVPGWKKSILGWFPWLSPAQLDYGLWGLGFLLLLGVARWAFRSRRSRLAPPRQPIGYLVHQGNSHPVYPGINRLGYLPDNDILIDDDTVGRAHATIHYQGEGDLVLTDLNSLNGSWVNGERIQHPRVIRDGDKIALGGWHALFQRAQQ